MRTVRGRAAGLPTLVVAAALLAGCGAAADDTPATRTPSPTTSRPGPAARLPATLPEARAAWKASAASKEYTLQVQGSCLCPRLRVTSTVTAGRVTDTDVEQLDRSTKDSAARTARRYPNTVEGLFALVERYAPDRLAVTYSAQGVPLSIVADPMPTAVDDEFTYSVAFSSRAGGSRAEPDAAWAPATLPAGVTWIGAPDGGEPGAQALIVGQGRAARMYLGLWGSSSCPQVPLTLRAGEVRTTPKKPVVTIGVDVDATDPGERSCTADYGPTVYAAALPAAAGDGKAARVQVVLSRATGPRDAAGVSAVVLPALPR